MDSSIDTTSLTAPGGALDLDLPDGLRLRLRALRPDDGPRLVAGFERLSPRSRFMRFFTGSSRLTASQLAYFLDLGDDHRWAVAAFDRDAVPDTATGDDGEDDGGDDGLGIGVASYTRTHRPAEAEPAVVVIDDYHRRGVGSALLHALAAVAVDHGIRHFTAPVLAENRRLLQLVRELGARVRVVPGDRTVVEVVFDLPDPGVTIVGTPTYELFRTIAAGG